MALVLLVVTPKVGIAQSPGSDSIAILEGKVVEEEKKDTLIARSPTRASIYSAVLPGLGQIYNRKYWKLPIVYGGLGTSIFFIVDNTNQYRKFRDAYIAETDCDANTVSDVKTGDRLLTTDELQTQAEQYREWLELSYVATAAIYVLNIVDAAVDAHLSNFDVSDDLSLHIRPGIIAPQRQDQVFMGLNLQLKFKR